VRVVAEEASLQLEAAPLGHALCLASTLFLSHVISSEACRILDDCICCTQARPEAASPQITLAAKLQKAALDCFMSDEQPPIRRVKMNGLHRSAAKLVAA